MQQERLVYASPAADGARQVDVSIFAESDLVRAQMAEDCTNSGLFVRTRTTLAALEEMQRFGGYDRLSDVVAIDCPDAPPHMLAALMRLDLEAARSGRRLVVTTTMDSLDDVFGCLDQSVAHILVRPSHIERTMLFTRLRATLGASTLREMSSEDRLALLRLTEQVERMAQNLAGWSGPQQDSGNTVVPIGTAGRTAAGAEQAAATTRRGQADLPDPRLIRAILRQRQKRAQMLGADLFADPAWDMLLDLTAARGEGRQVSITSLCIASGVPATTALRWIGHMVEAGLLERVRDAADARRAFVALTQRSIDAMARYFADAAPAEALAA